MSGENARMYRAIAVATTRQSLRREAVANRLALALQMILAGVGDNTECFHCKMAAQLAADALGVSDA